MKRSTTFKDPAKTFLDSKCAWDTYNDYPTSELRKFIRPNIMKMDQMAVKNIQEKMQNEKYFEEIQKMWVQENREDLRNKVHSIILPSS